MALLAEGPLKRQVAKRIVRRWCLEENQPLSTLYRFPKEELQRGLELTDIEADQLMAAEQLVPEQARVVDELAAQGVGVLTRVDVAYPEALVERLPEERLPYTMFYRGNLTLLTQPAVSILGSGEPSEGASQVARELARALAGDRHHLVGGYRQGVDRMALDVAREAEGRTTMLLPIGIRRFERILAALEGVLGSGRLLVISPFPPDAPHSDLADRARLTLVGALAEAMLLVSPDLTPSEVLPPEAEPAGTRRGLFLWSGSDEPLAGAWRAAGAEPFETAAEGQERITAAFGVAPSDLEGDAGSIDDLQGVEPIEFEDADSAIEMLGRTGTVPDVLARRLRERDRTPPPDRDDP